MHINASCTTALNTLTTALNTLMNVSSYINVNNIVVEISEVGVAAVCGCTHINDIMTTS